MLSVIPSGASQRTGRPPQWAGLLLAKPAEFMPSEGWRIEPAGILAPAYVDRPQSPGGRQVVEAFGRQVLAGVESSQRTAVLGVGRSGANVSRTARIHEKERKNRCLA